MNKPNPFRSIALAAIVSLQLLTVSCLFGDRPHPTDASLIENFEKNRDDLERLAAMCREDANMVRIAPSFLWRVDHAGWPRPESEWGITKERWDQYRELFGKLGLTMGINNYQPESIYFLSSTRGLVTGGSSKGYAYLSEPPERTEESLDDFKFEKEGAVYRHLTGDWYLFYEASG
jgi:hypothetical protein